MEGEEEGPPAEPLRRKAATEATINMSKRNATRMKRVRINVYIHMSITHGGRVVLEISAFI